MSTVYSSHPLITGTRSIRVLDVQPLPPATATNSPNDPPIHCRIRIIELDSREHFTALSYVWGDFGPIKTYVKIGDVDIEVTNNCHHALKNLRRKLGAFTIWVDAVCIDQRNTNEKLHQLPLMGSIYSQADSIYVWLGEGTSQTDRVMHYIEHVGFSRHWKADRTKINYPQVMAAALALLFSGWNGPSAYLSALVAERMKRCLGLAPAARADIEHTLRNRWITRVWTFQEILLAENPVLVYGQQLINWSDFVRGILFLANIQSYNTGDALRLWQSLAYAREDTRTASTLSSTTTSSLESYAKFIEYAAHMAHWIGWVFLAVLPWFGITMFVLIKTSGLRFSELIVGPTIVVLILLLAIAAHRKPGNMQNRTATVDDMTCGTYIRKAQQPQDMAFGIWAVLQKRSSYQLPILDPTAALNQIYWTLAIHIVQINRSVNLLYLAACQRMIGAPSWVPDWSAADLHSWQADLTLATQTDEYGDLVSKEGSQSVAWHQTEDTTCAFDSTTTRLTVRARRICRISYCARFEVVSEHYEREQHELYLTNLSVALNLAGISKFPHSTLSALGLSDSTSEECEKEHIEQLAEFCASNYYKDPLKVLTSLVNGEIPNGTAILKTQARISNIIARHPKLAFATLSTPSLNRDSMTGSSGRDVQVGDEVFRVMGVPQLLVFRRHYVTTNEDVELVSPAEFASQFTRSHSYTEGPVSMGLGTRTITFKNDARVAEYHIY